MGMLLMATFVAVLLFFFYAIFASSYGFLGGFACLLMTIIGGVAIGIIISLIEDK